MRRLDHWQTISFNEHHQTAQSPGAPRTGHGLNVIFGPWLASVQDLHRFHWDSASAPQKIGLLADRLQFVYGKTTSPQSIIH